jgi:hypothetical protein
MWDERKRQCIEYTTYLGVAAMWDERKRQALSSRPLPVYIQCQTNAPRDNVAMHKGGTIRKLVNNVTRTCETCYLRHQDQHLIRPVAPFCYVVLLHRLLDRVLKSNAVFREVWVLFLANVLPAFVAVQAEDGLAELFLDEGAAVHNGFEFKRRTYTQLKRE